MHAEGVTLANPNTAAAGLPVASGTAFNFGGGRCVFIAAAAAWAGTVSLQLLGPDGNTWLDCGVGTTLTANGASVVFLPTGRVRAQVKTGTVTGLYAALSRIVS